MADERENKLRALADQYRQSKAQESQEKAHSAPAREQSDATRERYRHIQEKTQADLVPRPSGGYGRPVEQRPPEKAKESAAPEKAKEKPKLSKEAEQELKQSVARMKEAGVGKPKDVKVIEEPPAIDPEARRRGGQER